VFDVACHVNDRWPYLGSRYRLLGQALTPTSGGKQKTVQVRLPQATVEITTELDQPQYYALSVSGDGELEISAAPENYKQPATVRWNYRIQIHGRDCR
jgi:hypothetical protein